MNYKVVLKTGADWYEKITEAFFRFKVEAEQHCWALSSSGWDATAYVLSGCKANGEEVWDLLT